MLSRLRLLAVSAISVAALAGLALLIRPSISAGQAPASGPVLPQTTTTSTPCPPPTAEPFYVEPVLSPTDQLSQTIRVSLGNARQVTISSEAGNVTALRADLAKGITITLLPDQINHLQVVGEVFATGGSGCTFNYTLSTTRDRNDQPLEIFQFSRRDLLPLVLN